MAKNSLFAALLRSPWWISAAVALALGLLSLTLLPD
jgi:restriction system protein